MSITIDGRSESILPTLDDSLGGSGESLVSASVSVASLPRLLCVQGRVAEASATLFLDSGAQFVFECFSTLLTLRVGMG